MSCFEGHMKEYQQISLDRFDGKNLKSTVYFLSHLHEDHTKGLDAAGLLKRFQSNKNIYLYCSEVTEILLVASSKYKNLKPYIKSIPVNTPTTIEIPDPLYDEKETVLVTLMPAFHCPGSVMCLFEGNEGTVLYTGDFRWEHFHIEQMHHLRSGESVKKMKSVYVDTTFCTEENLYIPSRQQCIDAVYHLTREWISQSPQHVVYIYPRSHYGHEPLLVAIATRLRKPFHVSSHKAAVYSNIAEFHGHFTVDGASTQLHACSRQCTVMEDGQEVPCRHVHDDNKVLVILPTTMYFTQFQHLTLDKIIRRIDANFYRTCYSFHSSYTEVKDLLAYLKPENVYPNVKPINDSSLAQTQRRLTSMLQECVEVGEGDAPSPVEVRELGTLKSRRGKRKGRKRKESLSDKESLDFGSPSKVQRLDSMPKSLSKDSGTSSRKSRSKGKTSPEIMTQSPPRRRSSRLSSTASSHGPQKTPKKKTRDTPSPDLFLTPGKSERSETSEQHSSYAGSHLDDSELDLTLGSQPSFEFRTSGEEMLKPADSSWSAGSFLMAVNSSSLEEEMGFKMVDEDGNQVPDYMDQVDGPIQEEVDSPKVERRSVQLEKSGQTALDRRKHLKRNRKKKSIPGISVTEEPSSSDLTSSENHHNESSKSAKKTKRCLRMANKSKESTYDSEKVTDLGDVVVTVDKEDVRKAVPDDTSKPDKSSDSPNFIKGGNTESAQENSQAIETNTFDNEKLSSSIPRGKKLIKMFEGTLKENDDEKETKETVIKRGGRKKKGKRNRGGKQKTETLSIDLTNDQVEEDHDDSVKEKIVGDHVEDVTEVEDDSKTKVDAECVILHDERKNETEELESVDNMLTESKSKKNETQSKQSRVKGKTKKGVSVSKSQSLIVDNNKDDHITSSKEEEISKVEFDHSKSDKEDEKPQMEKERADDYKYDVISEEACEVASPDIVILSDDETEDMETNLQDNTCDGGSKILNQTYSSAENYVKELDAEIEDDDVILIDDKDSEGEPDEAHSDNLYSDEDDNLWDNVVTETLNKEVIELDDISDSKPATQVPCFKKTITLDIRSVNVNEKKNRNDADEPCTSTDVKESGSCTENETTEKDLAYTPVVEVKRLRFSRSRSFDFTDINEDNSAFGFSRQVLSESDVPSVEMYKTEWSFCFESEKHIQAEYEKFMNEVDQDNNKSVSQDDEKVNLSKPEKDKHDSRTDESAYLETEKKQVHESHGQILSSNQNKKKIKLTLKNAGAEGKTSVGANEKRDINNKSKSDKVVTTEKIDGKVDNLVLTGCQEKIVSEVESPRTEDSCENDNVENDLSLQLSTENEHGNSDISNQDLNFDQQSVLLDQPTVKIEEKDNSDEHKKAISVTECVSISDTDSTKLSTEPNETSVSDDETHKHETQIIISSGETAGSENPDVIEFESSTEFREPEMTGVNVITVDDKEGSQEWLSCAKKKDDTSDISQLDSIEKDSEKNDIGTTKNITVPENVILTNENSRDLFADYEPVESTSCQETVDAAHNEGLSEKEKEERAEVARQAMGFVCETDSDSDSDESAPPQSPTADTLYEDYIELSSGPDDNAEETTGSVNDYEKATGSPIVEETTDVDNNSSGWLSARKPSRQLENEEKYYEDDDEDDEIRKRPRPFQRSLNQKKEQHYSSEGRRKNFGGEKKKNERGRVTPPLKRRGRYSQPSPETHHRTFSDSNENNQEKNESDNEEDDDSDAEEHTREYKTSFNKRLKQCSSNRFYRNQKRPPDPYEFRNVAAGQFPRRTYYKKQDSWREPDRFHYYKNKVKDNRVTDTANITQVSFPKISPPGIAFPVCVAAQAMGQPVKPRKSTETVSHVQSTVADLNKLKPAQESCIKAPTFPKFYGKQDDSQSSRFGECISRSYIRPSPLPVPPPTNVQPTWCNKRPSQSPAPLFSASSSSSGLDQLKASVLAVTGLTLSAGETSATPTVSSVLTSVTPAAEQPLTQSQGTTSNLDKTFETFKNILANVKSMETDDQEHAQKRETMDDLDRDLYEERRRRFMDEQRDYGRKDIDREWEEYYRRHYYDRPPPRPGSVYYDRYDHRDSQYEEWRRRSIEDPYFRERFPRPPSPLRDSYRDDYYPYRKEHVHRRRSPYADYYPDEAPRRYYHDPLPPRLEYDDYMPPRHDPYRSERPVPRHRDFPARHYPDDIPSRYDRYREREDYYDHPPPNMEFHDSSVPQQRHQKLPGPEERLHVDYSKLNESQSRPRNIVKKKTMMSRVLSRSGKVISSQVLDGGANPGTYFPEQANLIAPKAQEQDEEKEEIEKAAFCTGLQQWNNRS